MPTDQELAGSAERLHAHLLRRHYSQGLVHGPDAGVRFQLRVWRFFKAALPFVPWQDNYIFMQSQGYWILANWMLYEVTGENRYRSLALESTEAAHRLQQPEGFWRYPLPTAAWRGWFPYPGPREGTPMPAQDTRRCPRG